MSTADKRAMVEAASNLAKKTNNPEMAQDLEALMKGVNGILQEHGMGELQLQLVKVKA